MFGLISITDFFSINSVWKARMEWNMQEIYLGRNYASKGEMEK